MRYTTRCLPLLSRRIVRYINQQQHLNLSTFEGVVDRYNGVTVDVKTQLPTSSTVEEFKNILKESLQKWQVQGKTAVWLEMPIQYSHYVTAAAAEGFKFHHAEDDHCLLKLWIKDGPDHTPRFATHQLGVCGVTLREDTNELLVIQERKSAFWKFPGGLADLGENIGDAAVRETFEETGIKTDFQSVICFRQQHQYPGTFGRSDMYVVCRLRPVTYNITSCEREILNCQWIPIDELQKNLHISSLTHRICDLVSHGIKHGFHELDIGTEQMTSPFKGRHFTLFQRKLKGT